MAIQGGCLCGAIRYQVDGPLFDAGNCHCSMCRRFHGAAFSTYAKVDAEDFRWLRGAEALGIYEPSPGRGWGFCSKCGSSLGVPSDGKLSEITLGTVEGDPNVRATRHIFVGSKAPWYEILDALPQHDAWPPGKNE
jgi:hypothetical protein